jgi:hypothetical protein
MLAKGDVCWQSNCSGYLDYSYMRRKEEQGKMAEHEGVSIMAEIGGISINTIKNYDKRTGGAQSILKGVDSDYWKDVEDMSMEIRKKFFYNIEGSINRKYFPSESAGWQSWTCDMWALNFALWKRGKKTEVTPALDFSWATDSYQTYLRKPIFHLAGATKGNNGMFYKGAWIDKSPLYKPHKVNKDNATYAYIQAMAEVKE